MGLPARGGPGLDSSLRFIDIKPAPRCPRPRPGGTTRTALELESRFRAAPRRSAAMPVVGARQRASAPRPVPRIKVGTSPIAPLSSLRASPRSPSKSGPAQSGELRTRARRARSRRDVSPVPGPACENEALTAEKKGLQASCPNPSQRPGYPLAPFPTMSRPLVIKGARYPAPCRRDCICVGRLHSIRIVSSSKRLG